jgi:hypothetical protein
MGKLIGDETIATREMKSIKCGYDYDQLKLDLKSSGNVN